MLALLAGWQPRLALTLAGAGGALRNRLTRRWPAGHEVAALFPDISNSRVLQTAAAIGALEERNAVFVRSVRRAGIASMRTLVTISDAMGNLEGPGIFVTFHLGAIQTTAVALEAIGKPALAFRHGVLFEARPPVEHATSKGDAQRRANEFIRALHYLKRGGFVMMALDAAPGTTIATECLGRPLALARGAFALARMTGAPIIPLTVRWTPQGAHAVIDAPLLPAEAPVGALDIASLELALAQAAARWLERYLRDSPQELTLGLLRELLYGS